MKRRRLVLCIALCLLVLAVGGWIFLGGGGGQTQTLPDGSMVTLRAVTYGKEHRFFAGNVWQRLGMSVLPKKYAAKISARTYHVPLPRTNDGPALVLWIESPAGTKTGDVFQQIMRPSRILHPDTFTLFDDAGTEFNQSYAELCSGIPRGFLEGVVYRSLPRSSRKLHLAVHSYGVAGSAAHTVTFSFPNPAFSTVARPPAAPYPVAVEQGSLTLLLTDFHPVSSTAPSDLGGGKERWMHTKFRILDHGQPTSAWHFGDLYVIDGAGVWYRPGRYHSNSGGYWEELEFRGGLSTNESWKLRFEIKCGAAPSGKAIFEVTAQPTP